MNDDEALVMLTVTADGVPLSVRFDPGIAPESPLTITVRCEACATVLRTTRYHVAEDGKPPDQTIERNAVLDALAQLRHRCA